MAIEKTERLTIRWTPSDLDSIKKSAKKAGVSPSRYVREIALTERTQDGEKITQAKLLDDLIKQVRAIGKNINQIAHNGNQFGQVKPERFDQASEQLRAIRKRIYEAVQ